MKASIGVWSFIVGLVLAAIIAVFSGTSPPAWAVLLLAVLGLIVGILNVTDKEVMLFLVAAISFLLSFQSLSVVFSSLALGWGAVSAFFDLLSVFIAPAAAIVAVKALYNIAKD